MEAPTCLGEGPQLSTRAGAQTPVQLGGSGPNTGECVHTHVSVDVDLCACVCMCLHVLRVCVRLPVSGREERVGVGGESHRGS